jgi:hypothetical protein
MIHQGLEIVTGRRRGWLASLLLALLLLTVACSAGLEAPDAAREEAAPGAPAMDGESGADAAAPDAGAAAPDLPRMIIYTGELSLVVRDADVAQQDAVALAEAVGGYVAEAESYAYGDGLRRINLTLRVPAESFNETMAALRDLALEVTQDAISTEDVTQEYVDLTSRLAALEAKADRLEALMAEAEDTEAVLAVYEELSETQVQIEETKGRIQYLERRSAMATIVVHLTPDALSQPVEVAGWRPQGTARRAVEALIEVLQFLLDALIWFILLGIPVLAFIGLTVYLFVKLLQWIFGRRRTKAPKPEAPAVETPPEAEG